MTAPASTPKLRCSKCGATPTALEAKHTAREGGTHYKIVEHGAGIPGRRRTRNARKCGTWVLAQGPKTPAPAKPRCLCCPRGDEYNGFASGEPLAFSCPIQCACHD